MGKQQEERVLPSEFDTKTAKKQDGMPDTASAERQEVKDLTRLRIERNKAARHARCSTLRTK